MAEENKIIASTYEIIREIGAGGGGIVYLGRHRNLNKLIVLKADKRTQPAELGSAARKHSSSLNPETLSREVDALKDLSHTYIPQVYDYVEENGVVYTVMDYIEGESLDKPLNRGEEFKQAEIIKWARQLLEALAYLHSRPPYGILHSDIKPANIMLTPQGDIRLIDFNIALFLGEEGAVRLGGSYGYASPEHYGQNLSGSGEVKGTHKTDTESLDEKPDSKSSSRRNRSGKSGARLSGSASGRGVMVDVRSDIYGLGATLYHLLTGTRPAKNAKDVIPITKFQERNISPLIARIVTKAMNPNPDLRYQTAEEMLWDFNHLRRLDVRVRRRRSRMAFAALFVVAVLLTGAFSTYVGLRRMERWNGNLAAVADSKDALSRGDVPLAIQKVMTALPGSIGLFDPPYAPEAQRTLTNALGVYDLSDGYKAYRVFPLRSEVSGQPLKPIKIKMSPDGAWAAILTNELEDWRICVCNTASGELVKPWLNAESSATSDFLFVDNHTILYAGKEGLTAFDLSNQKELWSTGRAVTKIALSSDCARAATVYRDESAAALWDARTGEFLGEIDFSGRHLRQTEDRLEDLSGNLFALDAAGKRLAVSFSDGSLIVYDTTTRQEEIALLDAGDTDCVSFEGGFSGSFLATVGSVPSTSVLIMVVNLDNLPNSFIQEYEWTSCHILADETGVYLSHPVRNVIFQFNLTTEVQEDVILANAVSEISAFEKVGNRVLAKCVDGSWTLFENGAQIARLSAPYSIDAAAFGGNFLLLMNRDSASPVIQRWQHRADAIFSYSPAIPHTEAHVHTDKSSVMLFWVDDSVIRFSIVNPGGDVLFETEIEIGTEKSIRDGRYRRQGEKNRLGQTTEEDLLEVWFYDGMVRAYSAKTGELLFEKQGPLPENLGASASRNEEVMETSGFRVVAPLNATPIVYDASSGDSIGVLTADGNLMNIYQADAYLIAQYMRDDGSCFGELLNRHCQVLADIPDLTDVLPDGTLVFDDVLGSLRQNRIYSIQDLIALGNGFN